MAQGRSSRGEDFTENLQDYVEESFENSTNLPEQAQDVQELERAERDLQQAQREASESSTSTGTTPTVTSDTEAALEEHLAATQNVRGAAQADTANAGAPDATSTAVRDEAHARLTDRVNDQTGR
jgi:hypothetical protein